MSEVSNDKKVVEDTVIFELGSFNITNNMLIGAIAGLVLKTVME